ncbi:MAG: beta-propeller fold lactonase family protein, partial [bacterium]
MLLEPADLNGVLAMMLALALLVTVQQAQDTTPRAVIATGQRVTPAGVQSVFKGRVAGVRFGSKANELWVAVPGMAHRLNHKSNTLISSLAFEGTPGVNGVVMDVAAGRLLIASVGKTPAGAPAPTIPGTAKVDKDAVTRLSAFAEGGGAATANAAVRPVFVTDALADYMAGSPSVARRASASDPLKKSQVRRAILPLPASDRVAVIDADRGTVLSQIPLGVLPVASAINADGTVAYVANFGGAKPKAGELAATQCCAARAELIRIDKRGVALNGSVSRIDLVAGRVTTNISVGRHPGAMAWDEAHARLYVADGVNDAVSVIDTKTNQLARTITVAPFRERLQGLAPTALALSPDGATLYVALGGVNAVAVYSSGGGFQGLIPTGWYPASLDVSADGGTLAVGALLGAGSGEGTSTGKRGKFVLNVRGSVNVVRMPTSAELAAYTTAVAANNKLTLAKGAQAPASMANAAPRAGVIARAVPERPGEPSPIDHVVFIVKENRTYDQVLGDLGRGNGDSSLVIYGRDVTPNTHALSEQFVTLDHFFASGGN